MIGLIADYLAKQDPSQPHTLTTRLLISFCISFANIVLYGFYSLIAAVAVYLIGVELMGLAIHWMFYTFYAGILYGAWKSVRDIKIYWQNFGH